MKLLLTFLVLVLAFVSATDWYEASHGGAVRKQFIHDDISDARGYSQAVVVDYVRSGVRRVFLAGQTFTADGTLEGQIRAIWEGIRVLLEVAGGDLQDIVTMTSGIVDLNGTKADLFIQIRREVLQGPPYPEASMLLGVQSLARSFLFAEIQAQAAYKIPKDWKIGPFPFGNSTLEEVVYQRLKTKAMAAHCA